MFKLIRKIKQKGQSTLEYAILIIIILGALVAMQTYIKRGLQGRLKSSTDDIGAQFNPGTTNAYTSTNSWSKTSDVFTAGTTTTKLLAEESTNTMASSNVYKLDEGGYWGE